MRGNNQCICISTAIRGVLENRKHFLSVSSLLLLRAEEGRAGDGSNLSVTTSLRIRWKHVHIIPCFSCQLEYRRTTPQELLHRDHDGQSPQDVSAGRVGPWNGLNSVTHQLGRKLGLFFSLCSLQNLYPPLVYCLALKMQSVDAGPSHQ